MRRVVRVVRKGLRVGVLVGLVVGCTGRDATAPVSASAATRPVCRVATTACAARVEVAGGRFVRSFQSLPLSGDSLVTAALIMVHGINRDADSYFTTAVRAADLAGRTASTLVIAPQFITLDDAPAADEPVWSASGWPRGDLSSSAGPLPRVSAYGVIDTLVARLSDRTRFPQLVEVVIAGHSAGAQLVHRVAATSRTADTRTGVRVRFVAANPSTWLYPTAERPGAQGPTVPAGTTCADYDDWHYGLQNRNTYANALPVATIQQQLLARDVRMLLGTADTLTADLDDSCGAVLQGARRYSRGVAFAAYLAARFPTHRHRVVLVPNVGHSSAAMFTATEGWRALFVP